MNIDAVKAAQQARSRMASQTRAKPARREHHHIESSLRNPARQRRIRALNEQLNSDVLQSKARTRGRGMQVLSDVFAYSPVVSSRRHTTAATTTAGSLRRDRNDRHLGRGSRGVLRRPRERSGPAASRLAHNKNSQAISLSSARTDRHPTVPHPARMIPQEASPLQPTHRAQRRERTLVR